jgi:hypothetical protein
MLEQLPACATGLSRTERQGLEAVAGSAPSLHAAFAASQDMEEAPLAGRLDVLRDDVGLDAGPEPLLMAEGSWPTLSEGRKNPTLALTQRGRAVLRGEFDWQRSPKGEHWVAGTRLQGGVDDWRWDAGVGRAVRGASR